MNRQRRIAAQRGEGGCGGGSQVSREGMDRERAEERMMEGGCGLRGVGGSEGTWEGSEPRSRRR